MKPLGRKYYKCKTGGKHKYTEYGKTSSWWEDVCVPNKSLEKRREHYQIQDGLDEMYSYLDCNEAFLKERLHIAQTLDVDLSKVIIYYHQMVDEYCIEVNGKWCGYFEPTGNTTIDEVENYESWLDYQNVKIKA